MTQQQLSSRDRLGCKAQDLARDQELRCGEVIFLRKTSRSVAPVQVETPPTGQGLVLGLSMANGHWRDIRKGRKAERHHFRRHSIYLRDFESTYRAELSGEFDFVLAEISWNALFPQQDGHRPLPDRRIDAEAGASDPVISHLMQAAAPMLGGDRPVERLFVDQLSQALCTYLRLRHGMPAPSLLPETAGVSALVRRAFEMLRETLDGNISLDEIARACNVSRSHFYETFRREAGCTPHEWVVRERLEQAEVLIRTSGLPLSDIALRCGFSDQSHLTRIFSRRFGMPPGRWRQTHRGRIA